MNGLAAAIRTAVVALVCGMGLSGIGGCVSQSENLEAPFHSSDMQSPETFSDSGTQSVPHQWWQAFSDDQLNRLIGVALNDNFDLKSAWFRLREARALVDRESASLWPALDAFAEGEKTNSDSVETEQLRLGLSAEYELDLWGRIRAGVAAQRFREKASQADYQTAGLTLSAEVATTWYQLVEAYSQLDLIEQQIEANSKVLSLLENRFSSGQSRSADILRQRQLLEATREQGLVVESRIQVLRHRLAVLLGRSPGTIDVPTSQSLPGVPALPETGVPMELLRRRPDVRRAFHQLHAADREVAVAVSNQYPRLTLTASMATRDNDAEELFDDWVSAFSGGLMAPLFDAGQRGAEVQRRRSVREQRLYDYGQTILIAFREVEDALVQERQQSARIDSLEQQTSLAQRTYDQLRLQYFNGVGDYIDVLTALTDAQRLRRDLLTARRELLEFRIALYRALAGGFKMPNQSEG